MLAAHHHLDRLVVLVDVNGQQALGHTRDVLDLEPLAERFTAFGWDAQDVPGHDVAAIKAALRGCDERPGRPHVLLARTTFGYGVSFMRSQIAWHYLPLDPAQYEQALTELAGTAGRA
jgi:transketolase